MEINREAIEKGIIEHVADSMIGDGDLERRIKSAIDSRIDAYFKASANAQIEAAVNLAIKEGLEHEYCRVDSFGRKQGEPTTVGKELERMIAGYWNQRVDINGKPTDSTYSSIRRAEWIMTQLVAKDFQGEMKQHIVNLGGSLKDSLRATLHQTVNQLLSEVFHVKSEEDQKLDNPRRISIEPK